MTRAANLQNTFSVFCWKNFCIFNNFSVSLNLFLIRLKTVIMATYSVFEIALGTLVDIRSTNVPTFGGPALFLVDQRHMQYGDEKDLIMISQGNATWNTKKKTSLY